MVIWVAGRSLALSTLVTFSRQMRGLGSSSFHKKSRQLSSTFELCWVMPDPVSFEWGDTSCSPVFRCEQFDDFFSADERSWFFILPQKILTVVKHFCFLLSDDWWCFVWMRLYKLQPGLQLQAIRWLCLDRWEMFVPHPFTKSPDSCQANLNFIECWVIMVCLNEVIQVAAKTLAASNSVTFSRQMRDVPHPLTQSPDSCQALLNFIDSWSCFNWMWLNELQPGL